MSKRSSILSTLINHIADATHASGFRGLRFLHEINSFPAFYIHPETEDRFHYGRGSRQAVCACSLRGFQWSDSLDDIEAFARALESAIMSYKASHRYLIDEIRVISLRTDEGLMNPYGIVDMQFEILYEVNPFTSITADTTAYTADNTIILASRG